MTREEAIAVIRKNYPHVGFSGTEFETALRELIPELAESGDAMMEKAIVDALLSHCNSINLLSARGYQIEDVKAWLEKQKEQKPNYCHFGGDPNIERCRCCSATCSGRLADEQKLAECSEVELTFRGEKVKVKRQFFRDDKGRGYSTTEQDEDAAWYALRAWCEKKGVSLYDLYPREEWSEEDERMLIRCIKSVESSKNFAETQTFKEAKDKEKDWLKSLPERFNLQPKQEWSGEEALNRTYEEGFNDGLKYRKPVKRSDEDKKMSDWLIGLVNANIELSFKDKVNLTRWLEHLTIEKELPKNDKRIIDAIMIGYQDKDFSSSQIPTPIGVSKDEVIDWLKSLRPQPYKEVYQAAKHDLAIKFMNYLDENRPEGKMCLSNGGCEDIDKAFKENDWAKIMRYVEKYRPHWKPSEEQMRQLGYVAEQNKHNMLGQELMTLYNDLKKLM